MIGAEWSDDLRKMVGYKDITDFQDRLESWSDLLHPDDFERISDAYRRTIYDRTSEQYF